MHVGLGDLGAKLRRSMGVLAKDVGDRLDGHAPGEAQRVNDTSLDERFAFQDAQEELRNLREARHVDSRSAKQLGGNVVHFFGRQLDRRLFLHRHRLRPRRIDRKRIVLEAFVLFRRPRQWFLRVPPRLGICAGRVHRRVRRWRVRHFRRVRRRNTRCGRWRTRQPRRPARPLRRRRQRPAPRAARRRERSVAVAAVHRRRRQKRARRLY